MSRQICEIAAEINSDWLQLNFAAKPYLVAMLTMDDIRDNYGADSGVSVVLYFLSNATSWRGPVARRVKAELKQLIKEGDRKK